jgi:3-phosphoshikimate 1-carboxyvinyltransferase
LELPAGASDDIEATYHCVSALTRGGAATLDCAESGSTLRFLLPIAAAKGVPARFTGRGQLLSRPIAPLLDQLSAHGVKVSALRDELMLSGRLHSGTFELAGDISSQYVTGLLLALPLLEGDSEICLHSRLESKPYVNITLDVMARHGVLAEEYSRGYRIKGGQRYLPHGLITEGDYSQAAFFLAAGALGRNVSVSGLSPRSKQGDRAILDIFSRAGIGLSRDGDTVRAAAGEISPVDVDASDIPDLIPPVAALLAYAGGESRIYNAARLRLKESDRLASVRAALGALGADISEREDGLVIRGKPRLAGGSADSAGDHRIAMMTAVAAIRCDGEVLLNNPDCVRKSYPEFWKDFEVSGK